jgi:tetratricopeptide (TPR) repeat protein
VELVEHKLGSIADISTRLGLWTKLALKGLVRVEFSSELARQQVICNLQAILAEQGIPFQEISLPTYQAPDQLVGLLLEQLNQIPTGVVSVAGFTTAFSHQVLLEDALRVLNFNRERLAVFPLKQIWWMTPVFLQTAVHAMPDLNSWFSLRLELTEAVLTPDSTGFQPLFHEGFTANIEDARQRSHRLLQRFEAAQTAGAASEDLLRTYLLPALEALAEVGAQKELRDLTSQFEGFLGKLKKMETPEMASSLDRLASLYVAQGRYLEAEPLSRRALAIREQQLGSEHPDTSASLNNLAGLYRLMGRYIEAEALLVRSQSIREQQLGSDHPDTATSLNNLASLYVAQGRYLEAEPLSRHALAIREQQLGSEHPDTATSLSNLAELYRLVGRYIEAEAFFRRALAIREQQLGSDHPDTANSLNNLAGLYQTMERYREAEPLLRRALAIYEQQLGSQHPDTANSLNNLAALYRKMERYGEAEPLYQRSLTIREQQLGLDHPSIATGLNNLAVLYCYQQRFAEAQPLLEKALAIQESALGVGHPETINTRQSLATLYRTMAEQVSR